jgi:hypothetical protein
VHDLLHDGWWYDAAILPLLVAMAFGVQHPNDHSNYHCAIESVMVDFKWYGQLMALRVKS